LFECPLACGLSWGKAKSFQETPRAYGQPYTRRIEILGGNKTLALNSSGGLVSEAMAIVAIMDEANVSTIVPPNSICGSACAQVVFMAGRHRVVLDGGKLGMHSCTTSTGERSTLCNDRVALNAVAHGTDYGSVMAFTEYAAPNEIISFNSTDADCWGLTRWPPGFNRGIKQGDIAPCVLQSIRGGAVPAK